MQNSFYQMLEERKRSQEICEIEKIKAIEAAKACVRLEERRIRQQMKEIEEERRRNQGEDLVFGENGELQLVTTNLSFTAEPRQVTNMMSPKLTILKHEKDEDEKIFQVDFRIAERNLKIFLEPNEIGSGNYLLKKFASVGVIFYLKTARAKLVATRILCVLQQIFTEEEILPDDVGWIKSIDGKWRYVEEGDLTWERVKKLAKK